MLSKKQRDCLHLMVTTDMPQSKIAEDIGVNESTICRWKNKKEFKEALQEMERDYLKGLSAKAIRTMDNLLKARSELVRFNAAKDILDRTGHKPDDNINLNASKVVIEDDL